MIGTAQQDMEAGTVVRVLQSQRRPDLRGVAPVRRRSDTPVGVLAFDVAQGDVVRRADLVERGVPLKLRKDVGAFVDGVNAARQHPEQRKSAALGTSVVEVMAQGQTSSLTVVGDPHKARPSLLVHATSLALVEREAHLQVALSEPANDEIPFDRRIADVHLKVTVPEGEGPVRRSDIGEFLSVLLTALPGLLPNGQTITVEKTK